LLQRAQKLKQKLYGLSLQKSDPESYIRSCLIQFHGHNGIALNENSLYIDLRQIVVAQAKDKMLILTVINKLGYGSYTATEDPEVFESRLIQGMAEYV
jgi:hypothetical protein